MAEDAQEFLANRFASRDCDWCFCGADGHEVTVDRYGDPVVHCIADRENEDREAASAQRRRQMLGGLR
jgi:hypothetical protein